MWSLQDVLQLQNTGRCQRVLAIAAKERCEWFLSQADHLTTAMFALNMFDALLLPFG